MSVESGVKAQNLVNRVLLHHGKMQGISSREPARAQYDLFRALGRGQIDRHHLIDDSEQGVECRLNGITAIDGDVAVKYFLQDFRVRDETYALAEQPLEQSLGIALVRMRGPDEIHRDIRVDEYHLRSATP